MLNLNTILLAAKADIPSLDHSLSDVAGKDNFAPGDYSDVVHFYHQWSQHLHGNLGIFHSIYGTFANPVIRLFYHIVSGLETIFNSTFSLLGWDGTLSADGSPLHPIYVTLFAIGWALLGLSIILVTFQSITHSVKWSKVLPNIFMVALTLTVLPLLMRTASGQTDALGNIVISARKDINAAAGNDGNINAKDLAIQPIKSNIIDMARVANKSWDYDPNNMNAATTNSIRTKTDVNNLDLGASMDKASLKQFKGFKKDMKGKGGNKVSDPFNYHLIDNHASEAGQENSYSLVKNEAGSGMGSLNDFSYTRYDVVWIPLIAQCIILGAVFIIAAFRVVKDIFELTLMNLAAPLLAFQSVRSTKKLRDLVNSIVGLYLSIVLMSVVIKVFMIFLTVAPTKFSNLNSFEHGILTAIIYAGGGYALFAGISYFERVTGVSQGFSASAGQMMATSAMGAAAGAAAVKTAIKGGSSLFNGVTRLGNSSSNFSGISNGGNSNNNSNNNSSNSSDSKSSNNDSSTKLDNDNQNSSDVKNDNNSQNSSTQDQKKEDTKEGNSNEQKNQNDSVSSKNSQEDAQNNQDNVTKLGDSNSNNDTHQENNSEENNDAQAVDSINSFDETKGGPDFGMDENNHNQDIGQGGNQDMNQNPDLTGSLNSHEQEFDPGLSDDLHNNVAIPPETDTSVPETIGPDTTTEEATGTMDAGTNSPDSTESLDTPEQDMNSSFFENGDPYVADDLHNNVAIPPETSAATTEITSSENTGDGIDSVDDGINSPNFDFSKDVNTPVDPATPETTTPDNNQSNPPITNNTNNSNPSIASKVVKGIYDGSSKVQDASMNYLKGRNLNILPKGNVHGVDAEHLDD